MKAMLTTLLLLFIVQVPTTWSGHYKGGTITWKPTNPYANGSLIEILISEKHSFTLVTRYDCNENLIDNQLYYYDQAGTALPDLTCQPSATAAACVSAQYTTIQHTLLCTDFSTQLDSSSGAYYTKQMLSSTTAIDIAYSSSSWNPVILTSTGVSAVYWYVGSHIALGTVYPINSSPG
jgi:hypothetical protein